MKILCIGLVNRNKRRDKHAKVTYCICVGQIAFHIFKVQLSFQKWFILSFYAAPVQHETEGPKYTKCQSLTVRPGGMVYLIALLNSLPTHCSALE